MDQQQYDLNRNKLIEIYKKNNPELLPTVDDTLREWQGREADLFSSLYEKYDGANDAVKTAQEDYVNVVEGLKVIYKNKIRPLEEAYKFDAFFTPYLESSDFEAKPMVLLLGQYSVGKTTFIRHLIGRDFPGIRIGPEPTTDRFIAVMHGRDDTVIPGNVLCVDPSKPFRALDKFGNSFLQRFEASICNAKILQAITLIDTPGVLSGEKQRIHRQYDFAEVVEWFAFRADRILLLFDAHKLDISDEFKRVLEGLRGHDDKIRVVLNKSDSVNAQQLMRVYGALMWSLGKVVQTPEVLKVYISSFWDTPIDPNHENAKLFEQERNDLLADLMSLPRNSALRKINELIKRARLAKTHAFIMSHLKSEMPSFFGKTKKQQQLLDDLPNEFERVATKFKVSRGDLPNPVRFRNTLTSFDLSKFPASNKKLLDKMEQALSEDLPSLLKKMKNPHLETEEINSKINPFAAQGPSGIMLGESGLDWVVSSGEKLQYDNIFYGSSLISGKLSGQQAKEALSKAAPGMSNEALFKLWQLADIDTDGALDSEEFAVAMYLIEKTKAGTPLPDVLPPRLIPPSKR